MSANPPPGRKRFWAHLLYCLAMGAILFACGEIFLRLSGRGPWDPQLIIPKVEPAGRFLVPHPVLGYANPAGRFKITLPDGYAFVATHLPDSHRITHPLASYTNAPVRPEAWIFGCSITYGWSLNDEETYPWLLQAAFPELEVVNFGVGGYGTLKSLLQFQQALQAGRPPQVVVLAYGSLHDERNTGTRSWKKRIQIRTEEQYYDQPYVRIGGDGELKIFRDTMEYRAFPGARRSALVNFVEEVFNRLQFYFFRSRRVSKLLILEFRKLCDSKGIPLVVAGISPDASTRGMLEEMRQEGVRTVDISVDFKRPEYTNLPHDMHPSAAADRVFAKKLADFLKQSLRSPAETSGGAANPIHLTGGYSASSWPCRARPLELDRH